MLTAERLREVLDYDPLTGVFVWRLTGNGRIKVGAVAGNCRNDGYIRIQVDRREYVAHRLAWLYVHGRWPPADIDHRNQVRTDNRIDNLREASRSQNKANSGRHRDNASGFKGVVRRRDSGRWVARVKEIHLGTFDTPEEAHAAYVKAAAELFGEFARA